MISNEIEMNMPADNSLEEEDFDIDQIIYPNYDMSKSEWEEIANYEYMNPLTSNNFDPCSKISIEDGMDNPESIFDYFFPDSLFQLISDQTNLYARQYIEDNHQYLNEKHNSRVHKWENMTKEKVKSFIGILFLMGLNPKENMDDHWSSNELLNSIVSKFITIDKFELVWGNITINGQV